MPKQSKKELLISDVCITAALEINLLDSIDDSEEVDNILDEAFDHIFLIAANRYDSPRTHVIKSKEWLNNVLPNCNDKLFRHELRVSREEFGFIYGQIVNHPVFKPKQLDIEIQLAVAVSRFGEYGTASSLLKKSAKFGLGEGTIHSATERVVQALVDLKTTWIQWPTEDERKEIRLHMLDRLPNCVGYVDGTDIKLEEAPFDDHELYFSRKQKYSIQLQGIIDNEKRFRHVITGYPGSVHDARVIANCNLKKKPQDYFSQNEWIAGDSAYSLDTYLLTPYRKNCVGINQADRVKFNKHFSKYRVNVEHAFGLLKEVFGSLKELRIRVDKTSGHSRACNWIIACCVLYNMILPKDENYGYQFFPEEPDEDDGNENNFGSGDLKRRSILQQVIQGYLY